MFLTYAMGSAKSYEGLGMEAAHERLAAQQGIMTLAHFDVVVEHLGGALRGLDVPEVCACFGGLLHLAGASSTISVAFVQCWGFAIASWHGRSRREGRALPCFGTLLHLTAMMKFPSA